ncbi:MAG: hypothetical protein IPH57_12725 [Saprospiraceae bacterium]|nr:hypothetical protein [Saprospiraceae bacterium]
MVINSEFSDNEIVDVGMFFIAGRFLNTKIKNNKINLFGSARNASYIMAFEIWEESDNVHIENNTLVPYTPKNIEFFNHSKKKIIFIIIKWRSLNLLNNLLITII